MSVTSVTRSGEIWDGVLHDTRWNVTTLTYSFPTSASFYATTYSSAEEPDAGFEALNALQMDATRQLLGKISSFTNLNFQEVTESATTEATMRFAMTTNNTNTARGYFPANTERAGDTWYRNGGSYDTPTLGSYAYNEGFMHEIGHALGLRHGHDGSNNPFGGLPANRDSNEFSVMTYRDHIGDAIDASENEQWGNAQSYMMYDIAALQHMYGADFSATGNVWSGDSVYTFSTTTGEMSINGVGQGTPGGNRIFRTIWDGHGNDTYDLSNYTTNLKIDLRPGEWSTFDTAQLADLDGGSRATNLARGNVANALLHRDANGNLNLGSLIENAIGGSGNDVLVGNQANNRLVGNGGNDNLTGHGGNDRLEGGADTDTAIYAERRENYDITQNADGSFTIAHVRGSGVDGTDTLIDIEQAKFQDQIVALSAGRSIDFVLLQDLSASFSNDLPNIKSAISPILSRVETQITDVRFALASLLNGGAYRADVAATTDKNQIISTVQGFSAAGDESEAQLGALARAAQSEGLSLRAGNQRIIMVATDERYAENSSPDYQTAANVRAILEANNAIPIFVVTSGVRSSYDTLVGQLGRGTVVTLSSNSSDLADAVRLAVSTVLGTTTQTGTDGNDTLNGNDGLIDSIYGGPGNDTLNGLGGDDSLDGGSGNDTLNGGDGLDILLGGNGQDNLVGGADDDFLEGGEGADSLDGGDGIDVASYQGAAAGVVVDLSGVRTAQGDAEGDSMTGIENLLGTGFRDILSGDGAANSVDGGLGNDLIIGGEGNDILIGDAGVGSAGRPSGISLGSGTLLKTQGAGNNSMASAAGIGHLFSYGADPDIADSELTPHVSISGTGDGNIDYYVLTIANVGATITLDIDGGFSASGGPESFDSRLRILDASGNSLANNDDASTSFGGGGSTSSRDSFLTYSFAAPGVYFIAVEHYSAGAIPVGATYELQVSVAGEYISDEDVLLGGNGSDRLYGGVASDYLEGGEDGDVLDGGSGADRMFGGNGDDTYVVDHVSDIVSEQFGSGSDSVYAYASFALGEGLETLYLAGNGAISGYGNNAGNAISGNDADNILDGRGGNDAIYGNGGNDVLIGNAGADYMRGDAGDDIYSVDDVGDVVDESTGSGNDTVYASISYVLGAGVDSLVLTGTANLSGDGNGGANYLFGNAGSNQLGGGIGNDVLVGGAGNDVLLGGEGVDAMQGGTGNDIYVVDHVSDTVDESNGDGIDTVYTYASFALSAGLEYLTIAGSAAIDGYGNNENNVLSGNDAANRLDGRGGDDVLYGNDGDDILIGNAGVDYMRGDGGNDTYVVDNVSDIVDESTGSGLDTVYAYASFALGVGLEQLYLAGNGAINGYGNNTGNAIYGNDADNTLDGRGGDDAIYGNGGNDILIGNAGADYMRGDAGDDIYSVDNVGDVVDESTGSGNDTVYAGVSFVMGAGVDNLILTGNSDLSGDGNGGNNYIFGNDGNNRLNGGSGDDVLSGGGGADILDGSTGVDAMQGGSGNDTYVVDRSNDHVDEAAGGGDDVVYASSDFTLTDNVETLILTGNAQLNGGGNAGSNQLFGNAGVNVLDGRGGADYLVGAGGEDIFVFRRGEANGDIIADFDGNGAGAGDRIAFAGYSSSVTFSQVSATTWQISDNGLVETFTLANGAGIDASDYYFA